MRLFNDVVDYLLPRLGFRPTPNQIIGEYEKSELLAASHEQRLLMRLGRARSPHEAQRILDFYHAARAADVLPFLPKHKRTPVRERASMLVLKVQGHDRFNPYKRRRSDDRIRAVYRRR